MNRLRVRIASAVVGAAISLLAAVASAETTVVVHVRSFGGEAAEATVILTPVNGGGPQSCRTSGGTCRIAGVRGGSYIVTAEPTASGQPPMPRRVLLPPDGEVAVHVTLL